MLRKVWDQFFYDPYKTVSKNPNVRIGSSRLDRSFRVNIGVPRKDVALEIGDGCILRNTFTFESDGGHIKIGDGVFINGGTKIISRSCVEIGNHVTIAWGCTIYDHDSHSQDYRDRVEDQRSQFADFAAGNMLLHKNWQGVGTAPICIEEHAWLGFDVVVLKGVTIGRGAIIGARSVVARSVPPWTIVAGNPARVIREIPADLREYSEHDLSQSLDHE
jgi:galactoside O-acetyltransferase